MSSVESLKLLLNSFSEYSEKFELLLRFLVEGIPSVDQRLERRRFNVSVGSSPAIVALLRGGEILVLAPRFSFGEEDLLLLLLLLLGASSTMLPVLTLQSFRVDLLGGS